MLSSARGEIGEDDNILSEQRDTGLSLYLNEDLLK
jgi:hypothetical protein